MSRDRLVVCPECDEFIVEDEWLEHERACRPMRLYEMSPDQLVQELDNRTRRDNNWAEHLHRREQCIADAYERYNGGGFQHGEYSLPFWQPDEQLAGIQHGAILGRDHLRQYSTIRTIKINVPPFPIDKAMAYAIIREQIEQQWREFSEDPI